MEAVAQVFTDNRKNAPAGYMGAQARLYNTNGALVKSSSFKYNDAPVINLYACSPRTTSKQHFYSQSKVKLYNGNGYSGFTANKSPIGKVEARSISKSPNGDAEIYLLSITKSNLEVTTFSKDSTFETLTYGSGLQTDNQEEEPDLISAIGINNKSGYIKSEDLDPETDSLQETSELI